MTLKEKIDKLLETNTLGVGTVHALEKKCGVGVGTISKPLNKGHSPGHEIIKKIKEVLGVNQNWWDTGEGPIYKAVGNNSGKSPGVDDIETNQVPESIYRDLVEANSEYRLVPKTILQEEYRIMLKSEIDYKEQLMREALESKNNFITYLKQQITELQESLAQHSIAKKA